MGSLFANEPFFDRKIDACAPAQGTHAQMAPVDARAAGPSREGGMYFARQRIRERRSSSTLGCSLRSKPIAEANAPSESLVG